MLNSMGWRHEAGHRVEIHEPCDGSHHDGSQHRLWKIAKHARKAHRHREDDDRRDQPGERRPRAARLVDQRLRHAAADGKAVAEPGHQVGATDGQELAIRSKR
jgi:hypothetical protein